MLELHPGDTGPAVGGMQYLLRAHGSAIATDGTFSPATAAAVAQFQGLNGLSVVDVVAVGTWIRLVVPTRLGSTGEAVRGVQSFGLVRFAETEPVPINGMSGPSIATSGANVTGKKTAKFYKAAKRLVTKVSRAVGKASRGKRPKLSTACAATLREAISVAIARVGT